MTTIETFRDKTDELLKESLKNGILTQQEYSWRSNHLARAETVEEIESIVEDLLDEPTAIQEIQKIEQAHASVVTVMSERRVTVNELGKNTQSACIMGQNILDYSNVDFSGASDPKIESFVMMGETIIILPPHVRVKSNVVPVMAEFREDRRPASSERGTTVQVTGFVFMGSLRIKFAAK